MEDIEKEFDQSIKESGEGITPKDDSGEVTVESLQEKIIKTTDFAKQAIARAKKAEAELKEYKDKPVEKIQENKNTPSENKLTLEDRVELRLQGYSKEDIDFIERNGGMKALENNLVKSALKISMEQRKAEQAIPGEDSAKSDIEKQYTKEQLENMPFAELDKILKSGKIK